MRKLKNILAPHLKKEKKKDLSKSMPDQKRHNI